MNEEAKIKEVFGDEEFVKELLEMESPEEVQSALKEKDINLEIDEIIKIRDIVAQKAIHGNELSDDELESVAGGFMTACLILIGATVACSTALGALGVGGAWATNDLTKGKW